MKHLVSIAIILSLIAASAPANALKYHNVRGLKISFPKNNDSGIEVDKFRPFFNHFRKAVLKDATAEVSCLINFPDCRIALADKTIQIKNMREFCAVFNKVFDKELKDALYKQKGNGFIVDSAGVGLTGGTIWFQNPKGDDLYAIVINKRSLSSEDLIGSGAQ